MPKYSEDYISKRKAWWLAGNKIVSQDNYKKALEHGKKGVVLFPNDVIGEKIFLGISLEPMPKEYLGNLYLSK
jgi:hypothetical protein